ncbi:MAG: GNAT family N-acetyltransferase, partial [Candidatus Abyssubacteria bacterium]|nr:GNAT family N-acetyltransferase [Candidatus Abyssubacteria bacterium]
MAEPKIEIRDFRRSDIPFLNEIMKKVYGFTKDESYWIWWYEQNPLGNNSSKVAVSDGRVVAHAGGIPVELHSGGEKLVANLSGDLLADPEFRVRRAFLTTFVASMNCAQDKGDAASWGFANEAGMAAVADKAKAVIRGAPVPRLDKVVNATPFIQRKLKSGPIAALIGAPANAAIRLALSMRMPRADRQGSMEEIKAFDERFDDLWDRVAPDFPRTVVRGSKYLNWRYIKNPLYEYAIFAAVNDKTVDGYIILRTIMEAGIKRGLIIDLLADIKDQKTWNTLLARGIDYLIRERADLITCWMFDHIPVYQTLK